MSTRNLYRWVRKCKYSLLYSFCKESGIGASQHSISQCKTLLWLQVQCACVTCLLCVFPQGGGHQPVERHSRRPCTAGVLGVLAPPPSPHTLTKAANPMIRYFVKGSRQKVEKIFSFFVLFPSVVTVRILSLGRFLCVNMERLLVTKWSDTCSETAAWCCGVRRQLC